VFLDLRYNSTLHMLGFAAEPGLTSMAGTAALEQLHKAGPIFWRGIEESMRARTLFTLTAIVDAQGDAWFVDMDCNPIVHPDAYPIMLSGLFGTPVALPTIGAVPSAALPSGAIA
jgi:hypothetical protein